MATRRRVFLTGSERAEFEHIYGPLTVDETDPRFVLVDEETEVKIAKLPPGIPPRQGQDPVALAAIRAAELDAFGIEGDEVSDSVGAKGASIKAEELPVEAEASGEREHEPKGEGERNEATAESGRPASGEDVKA